MKENNNGNDTNVGSKGNSIEEDIKIALDKFSDNKDSNSAVLIVEQFILGNYVLVGGRKDIVKNSLRYILSDYKRVLKENEKLKNKLLDTLEGQKVIKEETPQYIKENFIPIEKVKDKIEEILNNKEYRIVFEGNAEFPDDATIINAQKYIKLEKMQE